MAKKKRKKVARKQAKKRAAKRKKSKRKSALKNKKSVRKARPRKLKPKKKTFKKKVKAKKALRKSGAKKKQKPVSPMARKTISAAHEIHHEKIVGPEGQAFAGYDKHSTEGAERFSQLDANAHPARQPQENPEEKIPPTEDRPGDDPDAEKLDDLSH